MSIKIKKGKIFFTSAFDVGWEINLGKVEDILLNTKSTRLIFSKDPRKAIIIKESPVKVEVPGEEIEILSQKYKTNISARIWDYGAISVNIEIPLIKETSWEEILKIADAIENSQEIEDISIKIKNDIKAKIISCIKNPQEWEYFEDYITYFFNEIDGINKPNEIFDKVNVADLILAESENKLSQIASKQITKNFLQYYDNDMAIIDWNSAIVIEPTESRDIIDVIEFSLTHLLELRYYDYMIDKRLDELYDIIESENKLIKRILKTHYEKIAREASKNYVEFSDFIGKVENSLKTVGDPYVATIFRNCAEQFRFQDWHHSISRKMNTLFQITQIYHGEITAIRSHILEIIIILLIAVEIIPLIYQLTQKFILGNF